MGRVGYSMGEAAQNPGGALLGVGRAALKDFALDSSVLHLNHGSYGATPLSVLAEQARWRTRMEENPMRFFADDLPSLLRASAADVAARFGGDADGWVFNENVTAAVNAVLNSLQLRAGDVLLTTSHAYGAVLKAMRRRALEVGAELQIVALPATIESEDQVCEAVLAAFSERARLLIVDHVTSPTAILFPVARIIAAARKANVPVFVDGAHVPGMFGLDAAALGADWYAGNIHKWMFAPKGCGVLWCAPERRNETHPAITSHGWGSGLAAEFDWIGTRDPTPWLCFGAAAQAHDRFGGPRLMARNIALASEAGDMLCARLGAARSAPAKLQCAMTAVRLAAKGTPEQALRLRRRLATDYGIEVPVFVFEEVLWLRVSAQIYNERADYERLGEALGALSPSER